MKHLQNVELKNRTNRRRKEVSREMKIGLKNVKTDLAMKHIAFEVDGEEHFISFYYSHRKASKIFHLILSQ